MKLIFNMNLHEFLYRNNEMYVQPSTSLKYI